VHQHAGFTGASTGQDQLTANGGCYGLALGIVEGVQQKGEIIAHRRILGCRGKGGKSHCRVVATKKPPALFNR
jgi:hypothetical protein